MVGLHGYWSRSTDDGATWSTPAKNGSVYFYGIAVSGAIWVMVGENGYWSRKQHNVYADTFAWNKDSGDFSDDISMYPIRNITIGTDIVIRFPAYTGHVVGDTWSFAQEAIYGLKIADKDGNVYVKAGNGVFTLGDSLRSSTAAVFTANLLPLVPADDSGNGNDVGTSSKPYRNGYFRQITLGGKPAYACRAWVNFDGLTNNVRACGNVSSITDHGTGDYIINFSVAMPDANYAVAGMGMEASGTAGGTTFQSALTLANASDTKATSVRVLNANIDRDDNVDGLYITVAVFR
jgi:hypothetical protein